MNTLSTRKSSDNNRTSFYSWSLPKKQKKLNTNSIAKTIYVVKHKDNQREYALSDDEHVTFGTSPKNKLVLDPKPEVKENIFYIIDKEHGKFILRYGKWCIFDDFSLNGIIVNGLKIKPGTHHILNINDEIIIGKDVKDTEFKYIFTTKPTTTLTSPLVIDDEFSLIYGAKNNSRWYFKNDNQEFEPTYNGLSTMMDAMQIGETKIVKYKSTTYCVTKITSNQCIQQNKVTKQKRELRLNEFRWYYQSDDRSFKPYSDELFGKFVSLDTGKSLQFTLKNKFKYQFTKISFDTAKQKNISTGFQRRAVFKGKYDINRISISGGNRNSDNSPFISHLSYSQAMSLMIGDKVDIRSSLNGFMYKAKIIDVTYKQKKDNSLEKYIFVHYDGFESKYDEEIKIEQQSISLAKYESITTRPAHRFKHLKVGDFIDINPIYLDPEWKPATISKMSRSSGQIQAEFKHSTSNKLTKYWLHLDNTIECDEFSEGTIDEKQVEALFFATVSPAKYTIIEIKDISNKDNVNVYESILDGKCKDGKKKYEIEKYLWHGTGNGADDTLNLIIKNGFDRSYNKVGIYGKGTYFAKNASYSVGRGYCNKDKNNVYFILLCRVIVGQYVVGNSNMKTIPKKDDGTEYESLVNNKDNPSIFVSWRDFMSVPQYLIKFKCV